VQRPHATALAVSAKTKNMASRAPCDDARSTIGTVRSRVLRSHGFKYRETPSIVTSQHERHESTPRFFPIKLNPGIERNAIGLSSASWFTQDDLQKGWTEMENDCIDTDGSGNAAGHVGVPFDVSVLFSDGGMHCPSAGEASELVAAMAPATRCLRYRAKVASDARDHWRRCRRKVQEVERAAIKRTSGPLRQGPIVRKLTLLTPTIRINPPSSGTVRMPSARSLPSLSL